MGSTQDESEYPDVAYMTEQTKAAEKAQRCADDQLVHEAFHAGKGLYPLGKPGTVRPGRADELPSAQVLIDAVASPRIGGHRHFHHKESPNDPYYRTHRDKGKVRLSLLPAILLEQAGKVMTQGFDKYGGCTWKETQDGAQRYTESFLRHAMEVMQDGPGARCPESGNLHLAHAAVDAGLAMWHLAKEGRILR